MSDLRARLRNLRAVTNRPRRASRAPVPGMSSTRRLSIRSGLFTIRKKLLSPGNVAIYSSSTTFSKPTAETLIAVPARS